MRDVNHAALAKFVCMRLADPGFRARLTACASDGSRPMIFCLPGDALDKLVADVKRCGGVANVFVAVTSGVVGIDFRAGAANGDPLVRSAQPLRSDCTVGVFVQRLRIDASGSARATYRFSVETDERVERGSAKVVALAG